MKLKTQHVDGGVATRNLKHFVYEEIVEMICVKHNMLKKDTQNPIYKPKSKETPTKSKTRHVEGRGMNPQIETSRTWAFLCQEYIV